MLLWKSIWKLQKIDFIEFYALVFPHEFSRLVCEFGALCFITEDNERL